MNNRPKIAILANYPIWLVDETLPRFDGHYAVWLTALSDSFARQDEFEIHWVTLSKDVQQAKSVQSQGQFFHLLPRARRMIGLYTAYWYDRRQIRKALKHIQPDLVHAWGTEDCYGLAAKDVTGCEKLFSIQGLLKTYMRLGQVTAFERRHSVYEPPVLRAFAHITAESPWAIAEARRINARANYFLFEYAVESHFFDMQRNISECPTCIYAGSDSLIKNVDQLIRVFSRPELASIKLLLAGVPPENRRDLPENIYALGRVNREEMSKLLAESWCLVHPSRADTGPTIAKEARVVGLPVILTENCGSQQHVIEGESGFVIQVDDDDALMQHVLTICRSQQAALDMGAYGQAECREVLSGTHMTRRLCGIYSQLIRH